MQRSLQFILTINAGSSSIKAAVYEHNKTLPLKLSCKIEHIGTNSATFTVSENTGENKTGIAAPNFHKATAVLISWLKKHEWATHIAAIGHRVVHGMHHTQPEPVSGALLKELDQIAEYDPEHLPSAIAIIRLLKKHYPHIQQVACFDTAFHTTLPAVAKRFAIPDEYYQQGIQRYGFHGISYTYLLQELKRINPTAAKGRVIFAHLGNGASLAAVKKGKCIDTSMGFTPAGGIIMSTRSGDLDPGITGYLIKKNKDVARFNNLINHRSGLLAISNLSADMQVLLEHEATNPDAALAVDLFCYQIKKFIGAYTAALEGLDALVFSGGIGENALTIRSRICKELRYAGIIIDEKKNRHNGPGLSAPNSKVQVYVIPTNEELMIARITAQLYAKHKL